MRRSSLAAGEPDAHRDRDQRDRQGRHQLEDGRAGEGDPQGVQAGLAVALGDLADPRGLGLGAAEGHERRQAAHHVEEVARQRRHRPPLAFGPVAGREPDQGAEDGDQRQRRQHDHGARDVLGGDHDDGEQRQHGGQHQGRDVPGQVGLRGRHPAGDQHRGLPGARRAGVRRREHRPQQVAAHLGAHDPGRTRGRDLGEQPHQSAGHEHRDDRQGPGQDGVVVDHGHDQAGDEPGLADDEQAGDDAARDHPDQWAPRRGQAPHQPGIGRSHPTGASRRSWRDVVHRDPLAEHPVGPGLVARARSA